MPLFTGKGDKGTTKLFNTPSGERVTKSAPIFEALGAVDEINSFMGFCKVHAAEAGYRIGESGQMMADIVHEVQMNLFIVQAELAGSEMAITSEKVTALEDLIEAIEKLMPPISSFFVSGGSSLAASFDVARTLARRAERRVVAVSEEGNVSISEISLAYMNRLSSILYALARLSNHLAGVTEVPPTYE